LPETATSASDDDAFVFADDDAAHRPPRFANAPVHLYRLDLDAVDDDRMRELAAPLAPAERARAAAFRDPRHARRYAVGRGSLRRLLARYLAVESDAVEIAYGPYGKPYLPGRALHFNLSHAERHAILAVSATHRVGIDVERVDRSVAYEAIAGRRFSHAERAEIARAADESRAVDAFFQIWTRREAYAKLTGLGIAHAALDDLSARDASIVVRTFAPVVGTIATLAAALAPISVLPPSPPR